MTLVVVSLLFFFQNTESIPINPDKPLEVCQVLRNLQEYRGKVISVRGQWNGRNLEGDCKVFTNRIILNFPSRSSRSANKDWRWDENAITEATKNYEVLNSAGHNVVATFVGRLDALPPEFTGRGFGHLGGDPAELLLIGIKDVVSETGKPVRPPIKRVVPIDD